MELSEKTRHLNKRNKKPLTEKIKNHTLVLILCRHVITIIKNLCKDLVITFGGLQTPFSRMIPSLITLYHSWKIQQHFQQHQHGIHFYASTWGRWEVTWCPLLFFNKMWKVKNTKSYWKAELCQQFPVMSWHEFSSNWHPSHYGVHIFQPSIHFKMNFLYRVVLQRHLEDGRKWLRKTTTLYIIIALA